MRQVLQNLRSGVTEVGDVPAPGCRPGHLLIVTRRSLISAGTERMLVEFGQASLLAKAKANPERVRQVLDKMRSDGLLPTLEAVFAKLDTLLPLGYCNAGVVVEVGEGVAGFAVGDRVVSNGPHAEVVCVPKNLCARIPEGVEEEEAAFTVLSAVGLQGIRLAEPALGSVVVVMGLGLVGLLTVQLLAANGCRVLGMDPDPGRVALAKEFGARGIDLSGEIDPVSVAVSLSDGAGVDAVLVAASTKSSDPMGQAARMCRKRGRIVLVGVTGLDLNRADFYEKELTFQVSCSYGPGRYDPEYEERGHDYPRGFVRWTAQRNFETVLKLMADRRINVAPLISARYPIAQASDAYQRLIQEKSLLGVLLSYCESPNLARSISFSPASSQADGKPGAEQKEREGVRIRQSGAAGPVSGTVTSSGGSPVIGVIGAGSFATQVLLPALKKTGARLKTVAGGNGTSAGISARKFKFEQGTSDYRVLLNDPEVNTVFILTRHSSHARLIREALAAGKHVFVEKPLCVTRNELVSIRDGLEAARSRDSKPGALPPMLTVGYNRRFSLLGLKLRRLLADRGEPMTLVYTVNAGAVPLSHWTQDPREGGRIVGEGCHFVDFLRFLVGSPIRNVQAQMMGAARGGSVDEDKATITLEFADGSLGTVHYFANGSRRFPKERVEVFSQGRVLVLDNFRALRTYGGRGFHGKRLWRQDKGHAREVAAFLDRVACGGDSPIPWEELEEVARVTLTARECADGAAGSEVSLSGVVPGPVEGLLRT